MATAAWLPLPLDPLWLLTALGAVLLTAAGVVVVDISRRPLPAGAPTTSFRTRQITAAAKRVSRGRSIDPPELQAAAIDQARRGLRTLPLTAGWQPVIGSAWILNAEDPTDVVMVVLGLVLFVGGLVGLGYSWLVQHRLDTLDGVHQHVVPAPGR